MTPDVKLLKTQELLRSALAVIRDLSIGYSFRELHVDSAALLDAAEELGVVLDDEDGGYDYGDDEDEDI